MEVLWKDETALVVAKPSGMLVHNSAWAGPREVTVVETVGGGVVPVHRLDRGTSGALLLAAAPVHAAPWQRALAADDAVKVYLALVRGELRAAHEVDHPLKDDDGVVHPARSDVRPLLTRATPRVSLVAVRLHTGRTHQARRHLHHLSHPVIGDSNYGKGALNRDLAARHGIRRLALHAARLELTHPHAGNRLTVVAPLPPDLATPLRDIFGDDLDSALRTVLTP